MPITTKYLFIAQMDVAADKEALLNEVYETEHLPALRKVPGVISVTRLQAEPLILSVGGQTQTVVVEGAPKFTTIVEIDSPEVLVCDEWAAAVEVGRWPTEVRPHTTNRRHTLHKVTETGA